MLTRMMTIGTPTRRSTTSAPLRAALRSDSATQPACIPYVAMAERKKRLRSAMEELDELKDKMSDGTYLTLCEAAKDNYDRLTREEQRIAHPEEEEDDEQ